MGVSVASSIDGVRPSITIRITGFASVTRQRSETGVSLRLAPAQSQRERGQHDRFEIAEHRNEGEPGRHHRGKRDQRRRPASRAAPPQSPRDNDRRAERAKEATDRSCNRLVPVEAGEADPDCDGGCADRSGDKAGEKPGCEDPDCDAETGQKPDRVPAAHRELTLVGRGVFATERQGTYDEPNSFASMPTDSPLLLFFSSAQSGPSRWMESLLAHIARKERHRVRVMQVDVDKRSDVARRLGVNVAPTLVLVRGKHPIARIEGRASAPLIEAMLEQHLAADAVATA
jgi:Thioredoxin